MAESVEHEIIKVTLKDGAMMINVNTKVNVALISHAIMLLSTKHAQVITGTQQKESAVQVVPGNILDRLKGNNGR